MDQYAAAKDTIKEIERLGMASPEFTPTGADHADLSHLRSMIERMGKETFSPAKMGRWLGYMQGVAVANRWLTLDQCKEINRRRAEQDKPLDIDKHLVDRLQGIYRIKIKDGLGPVSGSEEPENPNEFVRTFFQVPPIQLEAAERLKELARQVRNRRDADERIDELLKANNALVESNRAEQRLSNDLLACITDAHAEMMKGRDGIALRILATALFNGEKPA